MEKEKLLEQLGFSKVGNDTLWRNGAMNFYIDLSVYKNAESITRAIFFAGQGHKASEIRQALNIK